MYTVQYSVSPVSSAAGETRRDDKRRDELKEMPARRLIRKEEREWEGEGTETEPQITGDKETPAVQHITQPPLPLRQKDINEMNIRSSTFRGTKYCTVDANEQCTMNNAPNVLKI